MIYPSLYAQCLYLFLSLFCFISPILNKVYAEAFTKPKLVIVSSVVPWGVAAKVLVGDIAQVKMAFKSRGDPHISEMSPSEIIQLSNANLIILNGLHLEPKIKFDTKGRTFVVSDELGDKIIGRDPHLWLDPVIFIEVLNRLKVVLCEIEPKSCNIFTKNLLENKKLLEDMVEEFHLQSQNELRKKPRIIVLHPGLERFASRFNFNIYTVLGSVHAESLSPQDIVKLSSKKDNLGGTMILDTNYNSESIRSIVEDLKLNVLRIDMEGRSMVNPVEYYTSIFSTLNNSIVSEVR